MISRLRNFLGLLRNSQAAQQSFEVAFGSVLAGGFLAVAIIVASRGLGPERFGILSVSIAIMVVVSKIIDAGFNSVIPKYANRWRLLPKRVERLMAHIIFWKLSVTLLVVVSAAIAGNWFMEVLRYPYANMYWWGIAGGVFLATYEHVVAVATAMHRFRLVTAMAVWHGLAKAVGLLVIYLIAQQWIAGYTAIYYLATAVAPLPILFFLRKNLIIAPQLASKKLLNEIQSFWFNAAVGAISLGLILNVDILFIQKYLTQWETGLYAGAMRIALFVSFLTAALATVLNNRVARYRDAQTLLTYLRKSIIVALTAVIGFLFFIPFAKIAILLTIGPEYLDGQAMLLILVANAFITLALAPLVAVFYSIDSKHYFSISGIGQVLILVIGNLLLLPAYGLPAAAWIKLAATGFQVVLSIWFIKNDWLKLPKTPQDVPNENDFV